MTKENSTEATRKFLDMQTESGQRTMKSMADDGRPNPFAPPRKDEWGPYKNLLGHWRGRHTGWNMIALPFHEGPHNFRVLMNQYHEDLDFMFVDDNVPNRGLKEDECKHQTVDACKGAGVEDFDQKTLTMDYQQVIAQTCAEDHPDSGLAGGPCKAIHHEPGLFLHMKNFELPNTNIARLAAIPHGNSVMALGEGKRVEGMPEIQPVSGLPIGRFHEIGPCCGELTPPAFCVDEYLAPYKHFIDTPFRGEVPDSFEDFPGFSPANMNAILNFANEGVDIDYTTVLTVDTQLHDGRISNAPFIVRQAEPVSMRSTFWIQELNEKNENGDPKLRMQYSQVIMLNFFEPRQDQLPGRATWPHISINTLDKIEIDENSDEFKDTTLQEICKAATMDAG